MDTPAYEAECSADLSIPIVVDLDGTLTPADTLAESLVLAIRRAPSILPRLPLMLAGGRANLKARVAEAVAGHADWPALPYSKPLLDYLAAEKRKGRRIVLATAANRAIADSVATHLGLFDAVLASDHGNNCKGRKKLEAILTSEGSEFIYAGDSAADMELWAFSKRAILVGVGNAVRARVRAAGITVIKEIHHPVAGTAEWIRALRLHQWLKNLLLFVPLLTSFTFLDLHKTTALVAAFFAFSFCASGTYLLNDLWDLSNDRRHPRKKNRALASARISIAHGLGAAAVLGLLGIGIAATLALKFGAILILYILLTTLYSWTLKSMILIDVILLALLYTLRIVAGAAAADIVPSVWLLGFSVFVFLSLALIKRCAELVAIRQTGGEFASGRDYRVSDLVVLWPMGTASFLCAVIVFSLFASGADVASRYATPQMLWLVAVCLIYWLGRLWIKTARGEMDDDPLVYAIRDFGSRVSIAVMLVGVLAARFISFQ